MRISLDLLSSVALRRASVCCAEKRSTYTATGLSRLRFKHDAEDLSCRTVELLSARILCVDILWQYPAPFRGQDQDKSKLRSEYLILVGIFDSFATHLFSLAFPSTIRPFVVPNQYLRLVRHALPQTPGKNLMEEHPVISGSAFRPPNFRKVFVQLWMSPRNPESETEKRLGAKRLAPGNSIG
jgi:hypothetical protein